MYPSNPNRAPSHRLCEREWKWNIDCPIQKWQVVWHKIWRKNLPERLPRRPFRECIQWPTTTSSVLPSMSELFEKQTMGRCFHSLAWDHQVAACRDPPSAFSALLSATALDTVAPFTSPSLPLPPPAAPLQCHHHHRLPICRCIASPCMTAPS
jgi:hypothetical protein